MKGGYDFDKYILVVEDLYKYFGGIRAVDGVSLRVPRRSIIGLIGPNGSGKTTLFNVVAGLYKPDKGRIIFDGVDIAGRKPHEIYKLGLIRTFQNPRLWTSLTVFENVLGAAENRKGENIAGALFQRLWEGQERKLAGEALDWIDFVELSSVDHMLPLNISGGQMKLAELARALMARAKLLLLDEPSAGVNPTLARRIFEGIERLRSEYGLTFLIIEHRLEILFDFVDYVYVMHRGKIVAEGKPEEVAENPVVLDIYLGG
ncbi:ABC transporter ATP-binding protein [Hyperthermus butylicus]|uniref:Probable branched-chain amino acid transport ATP-binding protein LivG n=1 Tax=Hyperthermus butylicus (strain DSM 5456 / JCM 9403 / PLM1-5) TaxID=415426 RepID=A2BKG2_HYPBU|nr:ABC transporter ATP-binding protein [Hyperthermus butylicus]ABM80473.1 High-affinity branched-chain amino acid transport ATP-binding protein [Hyperthermus butylicus DSM 5456]